MKFKHISQWLEWMKSLHGQSIELGLARVGKVFEQLALTQPGSPVVTVAGTNGKGSTVEGLTAIYLAAGFKVGTFTSPYLFRYNEQIRIQGEPVSDEALCTTFQKIYEALGDITLTPFEYGTLAAFLIFAEAECDVWILEVGLGGRFDAVNLIDNTVSIITSIAIDHVEWLGNTREAIAYEKAGIFRDNTHVVCGEMDPPKTLVDYAELLKSPLWIQGKAFGFEENEGSWNWWSDELRYDQLPLPSLALQNMATVLMTIEILQKKLPVKKADIEKALKTVHLPGRIQVVPGDVTTIFDVSHNPAAMQKLAAYLKKTKCTGKTLAVFSMLADKDIVGSIKTIQSEIDEWLVAPLDVERAASQKELMDAFDRVQVKKVFYYSTLLEAADTAKNHAKKSDRIIFFGSFHVVNECSYSVNIPS